MASSAARHDETVPLLQAPPTPTLPADESAPSATSSRAWRAILCTALTFLLLSISSHISLAPQTAILQDIICREYYSDSVSPDRCKADAVQSQVAAINGWRDVFEILPAMLLAVPYGALADRIGRKSVLLLAIAGCFMTDAWIRLVFWFPSLFPVRAVWFAGLWQVVGAGAATFSSVTYVIVADLCPRDKRTTAFSHIQSASLLSQFLSTPIGAVLMAQSPWIPMFISSAIMIVGFAVAALYIPETLSPKSTQYDADSCPNEMPERSAPQHMLGCWNDARALGQWMAQNARVVLVLSCFYTFHLGEQSGGPLLLQYASKRLGWSLGDASYLISLRAGVNLIVLIFIIPALSSAFVRRFQMPEIAKDKLLAQSSSVLLALGSGTIFLAKSWQPLLGGQLLFSLGYAFAVPARSAITSMVEPRQLGTVYTAIAVLTYAGLLTGGPLLARCFKWGLSIGEAWLGMPFLVACGCFVLSMAAVSLAAIPNHDDSESYAADAGDDGPRDGPGGEDMHWPQTPCPRRLL